jgi:hypothetical protein
VREGEQSAWTYVDSRRTPPRASASIVGVGGMTDVMFASSFGYVAAF